MTCVGYMIFSKITKSSSYSSLTISICNWFLIIVVHYFGIYYFRNLVFSQVYFAKMFRLLKRQSRVIRHPFSYVPVPLGRHENKHIFWKYIIMELCNIIEKSQIFTPINYKTGNSKQMLLF